MFPLAVLTEQDVEVIHQATLRILSQVGIALTQPQGWEILIEAGAKPQGERLLLPPDLVEEAVGRCPSRVSLRGRDGRSVTLGDGSLHWHNLGGAPYVYDPKQDQRRPATLQDVAQSARLLDALEGVTTLVPFFTPQDVPGPLMSLAMYRHSLPHTLKPLHGPGIQTAAEVRYLAHMAAVLGPPAEILSLGLSPVSPLTWPDGITAAIIEAARLGLPLGPLPCPITGATAPVSLAGALAQQNAEMLACITLAQRVRPGLPITYSGRLSLMDPRSGLAVWGGVELGLASAATVQIGHRYGLPVNVYGLSTNAHTLDLQNGYERALNAALPALAGADELSGVGQQAAGTLGSYAQMVCDADIAASVRRLRQGLTVDPDTLALDVIASVMDGSRNFLEQRHTVRHLRAGELYLPQLADWRPWQEWKQSGRGDVAERAQTQAERLLAEHQVPPLAEEQEKALDEIMRAAERELVAN